MTAPPTPDGELSLAQELDPVPVLTGYLLVDGEYEIVAQGSGELELDAPAPVRLDVASLVTRR